MLSGQSKLEMMFALEAIEEYRKRPSVTNEEGGKNMFRIYVVRGHFQPFWYRHHSTIDGKKHTKTLVLMNIGFQCWDK